jgi:hypothetical protein
MAQFLFDIVLFLGFIALCVLLVIVVDKAIGLMNRE